jgi:hypothetical protein
MYELYTVCEFGEKFRIPHLGSAEGLECHLPALRLRLNVLPRQASSGKEARALDIAMLIGGRCHQYISRYRLIKARAISTAYALVLQPLARLTPCLGVNVRFFLTQSFVIIAQDEHQYAAHVWRPYLSRRLAVRLQFKSTEVRSNGRGLGAEEAINRGAVSGQELKSHRGHGRHGKEARVHSQVRTHVPPISVHFEC